MYICTSASVIGIWPLQTKYRIHMKLRIKGDLWVRRCRSSNCVMQGWTCSNFLQKSWFLVAHLGSWMPFHIFAIGLMEGFLQSWVISDSFRIGKNDIIWRWAQFQSFYRRVSSIDSLISSWLKLIIGWSRTWTIIKISWLLIIVFPVKQACSKNT